MKSPLEITPGPWFFGELSESVITRKGVAVCDMPQLADADTNTANGKSIAAVPDLLAALESLLPFLEHEYDCRASAGDCPDYVEPARTAVETVKSALCKAGYTY